MLTKKLIFIGIIMMIRSSEGASEPSEQRRQSMLATCDSLTKYYEYVRAEHGDTIPGWKKRMDDIKSLREIYKKHSPSELEHLKAGLIYSRLKKDIQDYRKKDLVKKLKRSGHEDYLILQPNKIDQNKETLRVFAARMSVERFHANFKTWEHRDSHSKFFQSGIKVIEGIKKMLSKSKVTPRDLKSANGIIERLKTQMNEKTISSMKDRLDYAEFNLKQFESMYTGNKEEPKMPDSSESEDEVIPAVTAPDDETLQSSKKNVSGAVCQLKGFGHCKSESPDQMTKNQIKKCRGRNPVKGWCVQCEQNWKDWNIKYKCDRANVQKKDVGRFEHFFGFNEKWKYVEEHSPDTESKSPIILPDIAIEENVDERTNASKPKTGNQSESKKQSTARGNLNRVVAQVEWRPQKNKSKYTPNANRFRGNPSKKKNTKTSKKHRSRPDVPMTPKPKQKPQRKPHRSKPNTDPKSNFKIHYMKPTGTPNATNDGGKKARRYIDNDCDEELIAKYGTGAENRAKNEAKKKRERNRQDAKKLKKMQKKLYDEEVLQMNQDEADVKVGKARRSRSNQPIPNRNVFETVKSEWTKCVGPRDGQPCTRGKRNKGDTHFSIGPWHRDVSQMRQLKTKDKNGYPQHRCMECLESRI